jgi:hypothetical protein
MPSIENDSQDSITDCEILEKYLMLEEPRLFTNEAPETVIE